MYHRNEVYFVGYASGIAGPNLGSADAADVLKNSLIIAEITQKGLQCHWADIIKSTHENTSKLDKVAKQCTELANKVSSLVKKNRFFIVFGGDHSCAIGTWSGVYDTLNSEDELGLIWIDAHMDSHTPETSLSGNIHGMPLASLLGHGHSQLTHIMKTHPKLKPENICLIGIRSYEEGEAALLKKLKVRIFFMDEVKERGLETVMKEALAIVKKHTAHFGVTIDIDAMDPADAPGTGVAEPDGIHAKDLYHALKMLAHEKNLIGLEIAEFDPHKDKNHMTETLIANIITSVTLGEKL